MTWVLLAVAPFLLLVAWREGKLGFRPGMVLPCWAVVVAALLGVGVFLPRHAPDMELARRIAAMPLWRAALSGLEDALFVLPALLLPRPRRWLFLLASSAAFTAGHSYQGGAMWPKLAFVPVVYLLASKFGIATTIAAHSLNDVLSVVAMRYLVR